jgi:hypothetical protein
VSDSELGDPVIDGVIDVSVAVDPDGDAVEVIVN